MEINGIIRKEEKMTIKSYTDLEQSKALVKILPIESADMCFVNDGTAIKIDANSYNVRKHMWKGGGVQLIPCWSLASLLKALSTLLDAMPKDESIECSISFGYYNSKGEYIKKWLCAFEKEGETTDDYIIETFDGDNPVDACYQMVIRLKEMNLI